MNKIFAQDTVQIEFQEPLQEIIISYEAKQRTPVTFQNITTSEIKLKSTGQEPSFLLSETPSITAYSDAGNTQGYSYFRMRGIDQTRINVTLDGVPLNEPEDQGAYFSNYPDLFNSVSKIQIQRGVGTSKNGAASYAGSIELFSPNLSDPEKTTVGLGYGSFNSLRAFVEYNSGVNNKKAVYVRASQIYSDGYKYNSSNNSQSVYLSSGIFLNRSTWKFNFLGGHQQNELAWLGVPENLINNDRRTNVNENEKDEFTQGILQVHNKWKPRTNWTFENSIYYTFLKGNYDFNLNSFLGMPSNEELYNYAFQSNLLGIFSTYSYSKNQLNWTTGLHGNIYSRRHTGSEINLGQLYENTGYKKEISVFSKLDYTTGAFTFFADLQLRHSSFEYKGAVELERMNWNFINPKAGLTFAASAQTFLYYSIGSTGREPTRNDLFFGNDDLLADENGNPFIADNTPERVVNHELGIRHQGERFKVNTNFYYMDFNNEIVLAGNFGPNGIALTNKVDRSFRSGLELNASYQVSPHITLINNSSYNYSLIKEQSQVFTPILTPPLIVNQEIVYSFQKYSIALVGRYQEQSYIDFANTATIASYFLLNARVHYKINGFDFGIFVNNITNAKYYNNAYIDYDGAKKYFVQAPINLYTSVNYTF